MNDQPGIRIFIIDDHPWVRSGLEIFLQVYRDLQFVGQATTAADALEALEEADPDVVLVDLKLPGESGLEAIRAIRKRFPAIRIVVLTSLEETFWVEQAVQAGAIGYLIKTISARELAEAIRVAYSGKPALGELAAQALIDAALRVPLGQSPARHYELTQRESEVLQLMVQGLNNNQIGKELSVSRSTIKTHVSNILGKLGVENRVEAVRMAVQMGLVR